MAAGESPTPDELQSAAEYQRQNARSFSSSMMAARFGMVPNWLQSDVQALNTRLYIQGLQHLTGQTFEPDLRPRAQRIIDSTNLILDALL